VQNVTIKYDPTDPAQVDDHDPVLARLRREAPVSEVKPGLFYLAGYKDVLSVCRAPQTFRQGRHIPREFDSRTEEQLNLGETDPPKHTPVRKVLASLFSPAKVAAMQGSHRAPRVAAGLRISARAAFHHARPAAARRALWLELDQVDQAALLY
jgi:cytochrome P450